MIGHKFDAKLEVASAPQARQNHTFPQLPRHYGGDTLNSAIDAGALQENIQQLVVLLCHCHMPSITNVLPEFATSTNLDAR